MPGLLAHNTPAECYVYLYRQFLILFIYYASHAKIYDAVCPRLVAHANAVRRRSKRATIFDDYAELIFRA